uniref:Uncharacterized protein n=1 Tax=Glossina brevipalpis TaxID=37001 RepID=A0A1A9WHB9_9MUSC
MQKGKDKRSLYKYVHLTITGITVLLSSSVEVAYFLSQCIPAYHNLKPYNKVIINATYRHLYQQHQLARCYWQHSYNCCHGNRRRLCHHCHCDSCCNSPIPVSYKHQELDKVLYTYALIL